MVEVLKFSKKILVSITKNRRVDKFLWIFSPKGRLRKKIVGKVYIKVAYNLLFLKAENQVLLNIYSSIFKKLFLGLLKGYWCFVEVRGTGFKFEIADLWLTCKLGFSHLINIKVPGGLTVLLFKSNLLCIHGFDYQYLKEFCAYLKFYKKLDSYKGKGICFRSDTKTLKEGKKTQQ